MNLMLLVLYYGLLLQSATRVDFKVFLYFSLLSTKTIQLYIYIYIYYKINTYLVLIISLFYDPVQIFINNPSPKADILTCINQIQT
jgi:hypothetical protein